MIEERETEITRIVQTIAELSDIFKDLAQLVVEQGTILDNIEHNVEEAATNIEQGKEELEKGSKYQKKSMKKLCIILLILAVVAMVLVVSLAKRK